MSHSVPLLHFKDQFTGLTVNIDFAGKSATIDVGNLSAASETFSRWMGLSSDKAAERAISSAIAAAIRSHHNREEQSLLDAHVEIKASLLPGKDSVRPVEIGMSSIVRSLFNGDEFCIADLKSLGSETVTLSCFYLGLHGQRANVIDVDFADVVNIAYGLIDVATFMRSGVPMASMKDMRLCCQALAASMLMYSSDDAKQMGLSRSMEAAAAAPNTL